MKERRKSYLYSLPVLKNLFLPISSSFFCQGSLLVFEKVELLVARKSDTKKYPCFCHGLTFANNNIFVHFVEHHFK